MTKRKQAVVIVHGMGEQRPLGTLRSFAEAVWGGSTVPDEDKANSHNDLWIVPDTRAGLKELARIRTRNVTQGDKSVATDFYELYWADKLTGNTFTQFRTWIFTLLLRWPHQVPRETAGIWLGLWVVTLLIAAIIAGAGLIPGLTAIFGQFSARDAGTAVAGAIAATPDGPIACLLFDPAGEPYLLTRLVAGVLVALGAGRLGAWMLSSSLEKWRKGGGLFKSTWQTETAANASLEPVYGWLTVALVALLAGVAAALLLPDFDFPWGKTLLLATALALTYAITTFAVPYLGDVARYVRASPDAVSARADIRERGLALLRELHGVSHDAGGQSVRRGAGADYERVIVVGHSLGSIIAYDVLRLLWEEIGPTGQNRPDRETFDRLRDIDDYCHERWGKPDSIDPKELRALQASLIAALQLDAATPGKPTWLVSDFVTLGSPLTHAEFLVSSDRVSFEQRKAERQFPTSPPMLEPGSNRFLYPGDKPEAAHHAAMFAATRWVNVYDPAKRALWGDLVSGPCRPNFGPGIVDVPVEITRPGLFGRILTHTDYWNSDATSRLLGPAWQLLEDDDHWLESTPPRHIAVLRLAMRLKRRIPKEPRVTGQA